MKRLAAALLLFLLAFAAPAQAHKLKVFATVAGDSIAGYAFFIGGGRARGTPWIAKDSAGATLISGTTDAEGRFAFALPPEATGDVTVTVDTREGHIASATLTAARLAGGAAPSPSPAAATDSPVSTIADTRPLEAAIEAAVQRQVEPLLERIEELDARLRVTDIVSGVFLILGLAGMALWARGRRK
ncbi:cobalamin biosynthesis protein CbiL [Ancylobacter sp. TS-1]|uniref:cobalamin biosynthesis protein CbiL n=1 Tax=Ancylobacter sp. TS-1 TaxID=1850374 RepID=UPI001265B5B4|nr:cobalamin biosynthesis protein CbiL [Ancylobacter sp. TS-1]QFR33728.1 cobalamin biosynthesis protein CbiL [Ancylobacter sp. TS-1]